MSIEGEKVRFALRRTLESINPKFNKVCKARNVSADPLTGVMLIDCEVISDGTVIEDVRLTADFNENSTTAGLILVPKLNSIVIVSFLADTEAYLSMVSEVDYVYLNANTYGGVVKIQPLVDKINALENLVNDLASKYNSHTHILTLTMGTGTAAPTTSLETSTIAPITQKSDLENTTVKHGNGALV